MKTLMAIIIAHAMATVGTEAAPGLAGHYNSPKPLIDDYREDRTRENVITEPIREFHDFMDKDGKIARGKIMAYNPKKGAVTIAMENGKSLRADLNIFSKADQTYVREWHLTKEFFTEDRFHISAKKKRVADDRGTLLWRTTENFVYDIILENRSGYDLNDLTIDYCIFYEPDQLDYRGRVVSRGLKSGTLNIRTLASGKKIQVETQLVVLSKEGLEYYKENKVPAGKLLGIWIRVYLPLVGGKNAMREYCLPGNLRKNRNWARLNVPGNLNK